MIRRIMIAAGAACAVILLLLAGLWLARAPLAGWIARAMLERQGVEAQFEIVRLDTTGLALRDVRLGAGGAIPRIELDYRLGELRRGRIRSVRLIRPQLRVTLDEDGISVAGLRIDAGGEGGPGIDVGLVSVTSGLVTLATPAGELPVNLDLEGGPRQGWRGWATAREGALAYSGWHARVRGGEAEFEMIGDRLLARLFLEMDAAEGPWGAADAAAAAATVRLTGLEQGFAGAQGEGAANLALSGVRAADPRAAARALIAAPRWEGLSGLEDFAPPMAAHLIDALAAALAGFDAEAALSLDVSPETVLAVLDAPARIDAASGLAAELRPLEDSLVTWRRNGSGWRALAALSATGGPDLDIARLEADFANGLSVLRLEGDLAPFGDEIAMLGAQDLRAEWVRAPGDHYGEGNWRAGGSGTLLLSGAAYGLAVRNGALSGAAAAMAEDGAIRIRPQMPQNSGTQQNAALRLNAEALDWGAMRFSGVEARLPPVLDIEDGAYRGDWDAPVSVRADALAMQTMRLEEIALAAPQGGLVLSGRGGVFELAAGERPLNVSAARVTGPGWAARGVRGAGAQGADGPLLQRTEAGLTFLNASAQTFAADVFDLASGTTLRDISAPRTRLSGPVTPEMELDAAAPSLTATIDTLGRNDLSFRAGETSATLSTAPDEPLGIRFALEQGELDGAAIPVALGGMAARGSAVFAAPLRADIDIVRAVVTVPGEPAPVAPAALSGGLEVENGRVRMDLTGTAEGAPPDSLTIALRHDLDTGLGEAVVDIPRIVFAPRGPQPQHVITALRGLVADVSGPVEARFISQWYGTVARTSGRVVLEDVDMATRFGPIDGVSTVFEMSSLAPLLTPGPQTVTMRSFNPGLAVTGGEIDIELLDGGRVGIPRARWPFAGGQISIAPFVWDPDAEEHRAAMVAERLNLGVLVGMFDNEALNAGGTVSGRVPIIIRHGDIIVDNAVLSGDDEGFISYIGDVADAAAQSNEQANLAFRALENLQYRVLEVRLDGPLAGEMTLGLGIEGFNPDVLDGFPFRFNIGLTAELMRLARESTQGFRIQRQIEDALREEQRQNDD